MLDRHHNAILSNEVRTRPRWGSLANENSLLDLLEGNSAHLQPTALTLTSANSNLYLRRHSAHTCPTTEKETAAIPPEPIRPPAVPKRIYVPPQGTKPLKSQNIPPIPPSSRTRPLPPIPPARTHITDTTSQLVKNKHVSPKQTGKTAARVFEFNNKLVQEYGRLPPAPSGPPPPPPPTTYHKPQLPQPGKTSQPNNNVRMSIRQDSSLSSDSFSQTSSPSYTTKSMETPLLPPRSANAKPNGISNKIQLLEDDNNENTTITKSVSTPASLQTIVRFQNGSNMSLHHRIIKDMRRPSNPYVRRAHLRFRFAQVILNAVALLAIGGGMAAYFKAYPMEMRTVTKNTTNVARPIVIYENPIVNPAPGICLPVIVDFCQQHKVPYNFTVFPNFMGHFGQPEAQQELEVYDAVVDVRCYELAWLFLCSVFVPKCGPNGVPIGPCRSLCHETTRRCGFFLDVFGLELPDYVLKCDYFQDSENTEVCIGQREVIQEKTKASKAICPSGFQCDMRRCIPKDWHCDGHIDCKDQSDELNCENCGIGMIHCGADRCISLEHMCDGNIDCPWGQDERNCLRLSDHNGDEGRGQLEVFRPEQQQWVPACLAYWDPATSPELICSVLGYSNSNGSGVINGLDSYDLSTIHETTAIWRMHQNKRPRNLLKELTSCKPKMYSPTYLVCTNYICGRSKLNGVKKRNTRIVGGFASKPGDWPFLAALLGGPEEIFYCAGVLIADQWVLTASHCVGNHSDVSGWTIQLGITRRHAHSYYGQKMKVKRVVPHPKYNIGSAHDNDVALFQLTTHVTFHEHLMPVCLPSANKELLPGTICTVIGWGKKEDTGMSEYEPEINEVEVPVLNRDLCNSWLENRDLNVTDGMICAGYKEGGKDACQGDSGGPLLCRDDEEPDRWFVGGIVSWGIKCAHPHLPGVYAYVPKYIPWIKQQMELYSD